MRDLRLVGIADDEGNAREGGKFFRSTLGVTACDEDFGGGILRVDFADSVAGLRVGRGCNGAGVDYHEFGVVRRGGGDAAAIEELAFDRGAVGLGGAAAELFDVEGGHEARKNLTQRAQRTQRTPSTDMDALIGWRQASI